MNAAGVDDRPTGRSRDAAVEVSDLVVAYGPHLAVQGVSLSITQGSTVAVIGPSGSGKSSLLRAISGLEPVDSGTISLFGVDHTSSPPNERHVGLMFQDHALFPHLTVGDNVAYGLRIAGVERSDRRIVVADLLERVGLDGFADRKPDTLSGGEQQRVALARTIALDPSLVMLDEPLGSLDVTLREDLLLHIRSVVDSVGTTSLYVTHDRAEAFSFADRLAVIHAGCVVALGSPDAIWNDPGSAFVARFVGHANVVDGAALGLGEGVFTVPEGALRLASESGMFATVVDSVFDDGKFRLRVDVGGTVLTISADQPEPSGSNVSIQIDHDAVVRLTG
jgi:ABC-type Fe3+/spermidine/putrescine transport system ATPase subunit